GKAPEDLRSNPSRRREQSRSQPLEPGKRSLKIVSLCARRCRRCGFMNEGVAHPVREDAEAVVIVGAGFGGLETAKYLGEAGVPVILIDRNNHHLFQPLLYQVATAALSAPDIAEPIRKVL